MSGRFCECALGGHTPGLGESVFTLFNLLRQ